MIHLEFNIFFGLFFGFYCAYLAVEAFLSFINMRHMLENYSDVPAFFRNIVTVLEYQKGLNYTLAQGYFGLTQLGFQTLFLWGFVLFGGLEYFNHIIISIAGTTLAAQALYPLLIAFVFLIVALPFSYYHQFVLEEKFGFNKSTKATFFTDQVKSIILSFILGYILIYCILWVIEIRQGNWWLAVWLIVMGFQALIAGIYPVVLAPLFNKFVPLQDGPLKEKLNALADKVAFSMAGIFTIDGSKRSSHSNAFFAGFGKFRRIVLFDTLINNLSEEQIVSVVAHEMGHNKKKHIIKQLLLSATVLMVALYFLNFCMQSPDFFAAFGVTQPSSHIALVIFALFFSVLLFPLNPVFHLMSRKYEYEADNFSVTITKDKKNLIDALIKLARDNSSNLSPHPWYSFYHYSHPTVSERAAAIEKSTL